MKSQHISNIVQVLSTVSIAIGIFLVIYEIRQTREIAMAQIAVSNTDASLQVYLALGGEDPSPLMSKACLSPDQVTAQDLSTLDAVFSAFVARAAREVIVVIYSDLSEEWRRETAAALWLERLFWTEHGRWWWDANKSRYAPALVSLGDWVKGEIGSVSCSEYARKFESLAPFEWETTLPRL